MGHDEDQPGLPTPPDEKELAPQQSKGVNHVADEKESIYIIPLIKTKAVPTTQRSSRAITEIRAYIVRHMKAQEDQVWIDPKVNEAIWARGITAPPNKVRVKAVRFEDGLVEVSLPSE
jgi:large subunit ribosomal protein L31e